MDGIKTALNILCSARLKVKARPGFGRALSKMLLAVAIRQKAPPQSSVEEEKTQRGREENDCTKGKKGGRPHGPPAAAGESLLESAHRHVPDVPGVVPDGAVGGEDAGPGDVHESHPVPPLGVLIGQAGPLVGVPVALEVGQ